MSWGIYASIIGAIICIPGFRWLGILTLFYLGRNREMYFHKERSWITLGQYSWASLYYGVGLIAFSWVLYPMPWEYLYGMFYAGGPLGIAFVPSLLRHFPPTWLSDLQMYRTEEERELIRERGRAMMEQREHVFLQIIRTHDGWESWLLTMT